MRKIGFILLFLISIAVDLFSAVPCKAKNYLKENTIVLAQVANQYYVMPLSPGFYYQKVVEPIERRIMQDRESPTIELNNEQKFPAASENYQPAWQSYGY